MSLAFEPLQNPFLIAPNQSLGAFFDGRTDRDEVGGSVATTATGRFSNTLTIMVSALTIPDAGIFRQTLSQ